MFLSLLLTTLVISILVSAAVAAVFSKPIDGILKRIITDEIGSAWLKYLKFAIVVVGVSSGVRIHDLERYTIPYHCNNCDQPALELTQERWVLEIYRTIIETLQGIAWLLLIFFIFALFAYVIVRNAELKKKND